MQISISDDTVNFSPLEVGINAMSKVIQERNYSLGLFKNNYRNKENFIQAEAIGLDIDGGLTIEDAISRLKGYRCIVAPTRNHRKPKDGVVADRFRIIVFLEEPITDANDYYETWYGLREWFPESDKACKDPSRFYYPSPEVVKVRLKGKSIKPRKWVPKVDITKPSEINKGVRGKLTKQTLEFVLFGTSEGKRHDTLFKAAVDFHEQGYTQDEFWNMLRKSDDNKLWFEDRKDEAKRTIKDAYSKVPSKSPNMPHKALELMSPGEILSSKNKLEWAVQGLLTVGGVSLIAGDPKAGKSTLVRQLAKCVARGESFLGREVKQGQVVYLALEEQLEMLNEDLQKLRITKDDNILFHIGGLLAPDPYDQLRDILTENTRLLVIDTMIYFLAINDLNSYKDVSAQFAPLRKLARETKTHILLIHHTNKGGFGMRSIMGSKAIHAAIDCGMVFETVDQERYLTTAQRGGKPFYNQHLMFDEDILSYHLGHLKRREQRESEF